MNPRNPSLVITQNGTAIFAAVIKSVRKFVGLDHQIILEKFLHEIDAIMIFTMGKQLLNILAYIQRHIHKNSICTVLHIWIRFLMVFATPRKLQKRMVCFCICFRITIFFTENCILKLRLERKNKLKTYVVGLWKFKKVVDKAGSTNLLQLLNSSVIIVSLEENQKTERFCS